MPDTEDQLEETPEDVTPEEELPTPEPESDSPTLDEGNGTEGGETSEEDVEPAEPVAVAPLGQPESRTEAPPAVAADTPRLIEYPAEFNGFAVAADGGSLADPIFDDPNSDEAATYFTALIEKFGGDEDAANREYDRLALRYELAKDRYDTYVADIEETAARNSVPAVQKQVADQGAELRTGYDALVPGLGQKYLDTFHAPAVQAVSDALSDLTQKLIAERGLSPRRAAAQANTYLAAQPDLYKKALKYAAQEDEFAFAKLLLEAVGVKVPDAIAKPSTAGTPAPAIPPRPTPPPMAGGGGRGGGTGQQAERIVPTAEERRYAEEIDVDPVKFAKAHRERFGLNGSTQETTGARR